MEGTMAKISTKKREQAFLMRMDRKSFAEIAKETGVSAKTVSRWEHGWIDGKGRKHPGWKPQLEKAWREKGSRPWRVWPREKYPHHSSRPLTKGD